MSTDALAALLVAAVAMSAATGAGWIGYLVADRTALYRLWFLISSALWVVWAVNR